MLWLRARDIFTPFPKDGEYRSTLIKIGNKSGKTTKKTEKQITIICPMGGRVLRITVAILAILAPGHLKEAADRPVYIVLHSQGAIGDRPPI